jgi:PadR family transcriptional regulator PadR
VTGALLDVLEVFLTAERPEVHGWAIVRATGRAGPVVYNMLGRLAGRGWLVWWWDGGSGRRRRCYWLTEVGCVEAWGLLAVRRGWPAVVSS